MTSIIPFLWLQVVVKSDNLDLYSDMSQACPHQAYPQASLFTNITATPSIFNEIRANQSQMYYFETEDFTSQQTFGPDRTLIVRLEPCNGVVYLFIRRTRPCWPNPWSCVGTTDTCEWTHYQSIINGTTDGQATLLELPLTSTRWFITVYAKTDAKYSLSIVDDPSTFPRFSSRGGLIGSRQVNANTIELSWGRIVFVPNTTTIEDSTTYTVYSSMYFESSANDYLPNPNMLISPSYILDTVCGLTTNTDHPYSIVTCTTDVCSTNVTGLINKRKYVMNVVGNQAGIGIAFAGTLVEALFDASNTSDADRQTLENVGITIGSVLAVCLGTYFWLYSKYH